MKDVKIVYHVTGTCGDFEIHVIKSTRLKEIKNHIILIRKVDKFETA